MNMILYSSLTTYSTFIVSFSGDKPKKKLLNICSGALNAKYGLKAGHALNTIYRFKAEGRFECQIWTQLDIDIYKWKNKSSIDLMCVQKRLIIND